MQVPQCSVFQIASYFLHLASLQNVCLSNFHVQKMVYYAQGYHFVFHGTRLVQDDNIHSKDGPSYGGELANCLESPTHKLIDSRGVNTLNHVHLEEFLQVIFELNKPFSEWDLACTSHAEVPCYRTKHEEAISENLYIEEFGKIQRVVLFYNTYMALGGSVANLSLLLSFQRVIQRWLISQTYSIEDILMEFRYTPQCESANE